MGYKRYDPVMTVIDGKSIMMKNSYGYFSAEYVRQSGIPIIKQREPYMFSKTQCKKMKKPVSENERPVAFQRAMNGYYALYRRD